MRKSFVRATALACLLVAGLTASAPALAQPEPAKNTSTPIVTEVPIPISGTTPGSDAERIAQYLTSGRVEDLAQYIGIIYNFLISIVGMVAAVAMIIGGFRYLVSAGDTNKINAAKGQMANALIGLVLALGAYTILNTINPKMLQLTVPGVTPVKTELFTLPNCEDIKVPVTPAGDGVECGYAGKYVQGSAEQVCIYAGTCRLTLWASSGDKDFGHNTCVQHAGMETKKVLEALAKDKNTKFAECLSCGEINVKKARDMKFSGIQVACEAWMQAFSLVPSSFKTYKRKGTVEGHGDIEYTVKDGLFYGCYPRQKNEGCVGVALYCWDITRNDDSLSEDDREATGCEGYDEEPAPFWGSEVNEDGTVKTMSARRGKCTGAFEGVALGAVDEGDLNSLECLPQHLGTVCASNPCYNYVDPETNITPFIGGCKNASGTVFAVQRVVRHGDIGSVNDCRCQVIDKNCSGAD